MSDLIEIREFTQVTRASKIDEENGVLHDLVCLGPVSANGRDYPESTQRAALPLMEGRQSFVNHAKGAAEPSVYDLLGVWRDLYVKEGKTWGKFHYFKTHRLAPTLVEAARRPELNTSLGFSINARGRVESRGARQVVESLERVDSIDCVSQPASVAGLYESRQSMNTVRQLIESLKPRRPKYAQALQEMADAGVMSPEATMDAPPEAAEGPADHEAALLDAAAQVLRDDSLSSADKMTKIRKILAIVDGKSGKADAPAEPAEESRKLKADNERLLAEKLVRKAAGKANVALSEALCEALARPGMTEQQAADVVAELKGAAGSQKPRSAGPVVPAKGGSGAVLESKTEIPAGAKDRAAWLKRGTT